MSQLTGAPGGAPIQLNRRNDRNDEKNEEKQTTRCTLTSDPAFPHALLRIHMPHTSSYGQRPIQLFVVDQSGSMAGGPWTQILSVLTMVVNHSRQNMQTPPMCITYHSIATLQSAEHVLTQRAGGSTNFIAAFKAVQDYIKTCTNKNIVVTFMTDGQETDNKPPALTAALNQLRFFIANCGKHVTVHAIGYTPSHDVNLLQSIRAIGTREGMYRYAESRGLEEKFIELFDWVDTAQEIHVDVDGHKHTVNAEIGDGELDAEVWIPKPTNPITSITVQIGTERHIMDVIPTSSNPIFIISCLGRIPITTQVELDDIQSQLNRIKMFGHGMTRIERQTLFTLRSELQERLDAYHQIMAELARTSTSNVAAVAKLQDLAFAHTFTKASRKRRMDQRAAKNQGEMSQIDARLNALVIPSNAFDGVDVDEFTCFLTQSNVKELMDEAKDDVIGFGLLVERSEFVVDAPSMITLRATSTTIVSKSACEDAIRHRIHVAGHDPSQAHGGFVSTPHWANPVVKDVQDKNGINQQSLPRFTIGTSGEAINAFLPLYICPAHAERVMVVLKPLLGYFFALDPLSFKEDQYLAMFTLLGHLLQRSSSERDEWIIYEYSKILKCVMVEAKKYLGYDLVENFITSLAGRVKGSIGCQNLLTIVGWAYVNMPEDADALTENVLRFPLLEELIRRTCENMFHGAPKSLLDQHVRELLYGETQADHDEKKQESKEETDTLISTMASLNIKSNDTINTKYAEWAKYKVGYKTRAVAQPVDTSVDDEVKATTPNATSLVIMEMNDIIRNKIRTLMTGITSPWSKYISTALLRIGIHPFDVDMDAHMLRPLLIQSIRLCTNDHVNHAISHSTYVDVRQDQNKILDIMHQQYQAHVIQQQNNIIEHIRTLAIARRLVATDDIWSFVGRLMATCPTRGGMIWDAMLALIMDQTRPKSHGGYCWPLLEYKIRSLMTGQLINTKNGKAYDVLAQGQAWFADKRTCERIHEILGDDAYLALELSMRGRECGHVYRISDIPNRHGHCNSHPNRKLRRKWGG